MEATAIGSESYSEFKHTKFFRDELMLACFGGRAEFRFYFRTVLRDWKKEVHIFLTHAENNEKFVVPIVLYTPIDLYRVN